MKQLKSSLLLKITAFVLAILSAVVGVSAGVVLLYGYNQGVYGEHTWYRNGVRTDSDGTFFTTAICSNLANQYSWRLTEAYANGIDLQEMYGADFYSFDFSLRETDEHGRPLDGTVRPDGNYGYVMGDSHQFDAGNDSNQDDERAGKPYYVQIAVRDPITGGDEFFYANRTYDVMKRLAPYLIPVLASGLLLALVCFVFLCCAAGHRKGREGITPNGLDKIPFDLYAAILGGGIVLCLCFGFEFVSYSYYDYGLNLLAACAMLLPCSVLGLGLTLSFATRAKLGKWWRNTIIYMLARWLMKNGKVAWHGLGRMVHALPMIWRAAVIVPAALLIEVWLISVAQWDGGAAIVCFLYNILLAVLILFGLWQLRKLQKGGQILASGKLAAKIDTKRMYWDFKKHGENLNAIADGMSIAVEERLRSERLKTELITNVSHDIKTPLTSIVNYVDLLQKPHTEDEGFEYLAVLQRQSARLKKLTEDLVEASKASTGNVAANLVRTNVVEIVNQALGEYTERLAAGKLTVLTDMPDKDVPVLADGRLLWRVMDNLLSNVCKYAMSGTRVYVSVGRSGETVIAVKNISREPLNVSADELMERFVRGDTARSTEGSGLGLNIARSLTQLQGGSFELFVDGDFFKAEVRFPSL